MIKWYNWVLFSIVVLIALSMSWYSMMDLSTNVFDIPMLLSAVVSLAFDIGALFLGLMSIEYAKTSDSGFWTELWTFAFVATSVYINVQHAVLSNYGPAGVVMFGAAPIIAGVMLKILLSFIARQAKRDAGRVIDKLPSVGWMTWIRYTKPTWTLMSVAMRQRIVTAADRLDIGEDRHQLFSDKPRTSLGQLETKTETRSETSLGQDKDKNKTPQLLSQPVARQLTSSDNLSLPVWLPDEPDMKPATLVRTCADNGVFDLETIYNYAKTMKGQDVNKGSLRKALDREKQRQQ